MLITQTNPGSFDCIVRFANHSTNGAVIKNVSLLSKLKANKIWDYCCVFSTSTHTYQINTYAGPHF